MKTTLLAGLTALLLTHTAIAEPIQESIQEPIAARESADRTELAKQLSDQFMARTARIKATLKLSPEQTKNWSDFEVILVDIGKTRAERVIALRAALRKRPVDAVEQIRAEADFTRERAGEQKRLADAAEPLLAKLNDPQRRRFSEQLFSISRALGSD
jgi:GrpB-like predicted nucleotidyltransferase (UPF0157 family)